MVPQEAPPELGNNFVAIVKSRNRAEVLLFIESFPDLLWGEYLCLLSESEQQWLFAALKQKQSADRD